MSDLVIVAIMTAIPPTLVAVFSHRWMVKKVPKEVEKVIEEKVLPVIKK